MHKYYHKELSGYLCCTLKHAERALCRYVVDVGSNRTCCGIPESQLKDLKLFKQPVILLDK